MAIAIISVTFAKTLDFPEKIIYIFLYFQESLEYLDNLFRKLRVFSIFV